MITPEHVIKMKARIVSLTSVVEFAEIISSFIPTSWSKNDTAATEGKTIKTVNIKFD